MKGPTHNYQLSVDYCAFMVAILLGRHEVNIGNYDIKWSADELAPKLNSLPYAKTANY